MQFPDVETASEATKFDKNVYIITQNIVHTRAQYMQELVEIQGIYLVKEVEIGNALDDVLLKCEEKKPFYHPKNAQKPRPVHHIQPTYNRRIMKR